VVLEDLEALVVQDSVSVAQVLVSVVLVLASAVRGSALALVALGVGALELHFLED
jgi:hypothetical protein